MATLSTRTAATATKPATKKPAAKAVAAKTTASAKTTSQKTAVKKIAAPKAAVAQKPAATKTAAKPSPRAKAAPSPAQRHSMIQEAAYFIAESNGFAGGAMEHWVMAEAQINAMLSSRQT